LDESEKSALYNLARAYERKGLTDLALKEYQIIYEQDMRYKDIAHKIPVLYEKKIQEEQEQEGRDARTPRAQKIEKPSAGEIRCPKCLNIIPAHTVYCNFCNCKVGFTETELEAQAAKRKARITPGEEVTLSHVDGSTEDTETGSGLELDES
jgi:hypothetical protein